MSGERVRVRLEPLGVEFDVERGGELVSALSEHGVEFPCGASGHCGGCGVQVRTGWLAATRADREIFTEEELSDGWRLACQARPEISLVLECGQWHMDVLADDAMLPSAGRKGLGIAIDLGTTTIAAQLIDRAHGEVLAVDTALNPQAVFGSDVMSRIRAALEGADLTTPIRTSLGEMVRRLVQGRADAVAEVVLVGNTVMHHLFSGCPVEALAAAPFESAHLGEQMFAPADLRWELPDRCTVRFARCLGGFVGSDILAGIVAVGMHRSAELLALVDLGTNGEIAIGNCDGIVCASTAAGPAFEAGAIRMGMRAATGAIAHVSVLNGALHATVIGGGAPRGICGSGLVDAVAAGLETGAIQASGRIADGSKRFPITGPVVLQQADVRELQLAKGAIAAGFGILLRRLGASAGDLQAVHLAGAFGNYVQIASALRIGLLHAETGQIHAAGNTALRGAKLLLTAPEPMLPQIEHFSLAADPAFQDEFAESMRFPAEA
ncbi:MAG: ASKHA domain-containing protein [Terracidiphilus sp.]|nr:ASKHA domain-containing protein [Terracidiphilus sp.]